MKFNKDLIMGVVVVIVLFGILATMPVKPDEGKIRTTTLAKGDTPTALSAKVGQVPDSFEISVATDKYTYKSEEKINFTITLNSPIKTDDYEINVFGVKNKYGAYKVDWKHKPDLMPGQNVMSFEKTVPSCYGCSGITAGVYPVYAVIYDKKDNAIANASVKINITE